MTIHLIDGTYELFRHRVKGFAARHGESVLGRTRGSRHSIVRER